ncbi:putative mannosyl-oligosaccharide glucosidase [Neolecta irregularis DAH-3]|uniref:Mannosyl-oligosaccharide glucosidase n=1 Tax=Neolecta irregularis (strain DAH-3) TaxID=1198029 RepID=A0A1U7LI93_NEOID|nr:putative mannosyl-oligosaccharide glucosidase [Neolecta irregularis DAH-3]|eukprot:OLL22364.1 putative mannosyl-oligosaccharide glucosidase [Neolecta irregularis DAH-3]
MSCIWVLLFSALVIAQQHLSTESLLSAVAKAQNDSLLWGPYRPQLYAGFRPRIPKSLLTGIMWANVDDMGSINDIRHTCEQSHDILGYGWDEFDPRTGGIQRIRDVGMGVDIETEFVKVSGGSRGGHWALRVRGTPRDNEGLGNLEITSAGNSNGIEGPVEIVGSAPILGDFSFEITTGPDSNKYPQPQHDSSKLVNLQNTQFASIQVPGNVIWKAKDLLFSEISFVFQRLEKRYGKEKLPPAAILYTLPNKKDPLANLHFTQKTFQGSFQFDILYSSLSFGEQRMTSKRLDNQLEHLDFSFKDHFEKTFPLKEPYTSLSYRQFAQSLFSNLIGGIGYFHGDSLVGKIIDDDEEEEFWEQARAGEGVDGGDSKRAEEKELFTSIPSRPFFPRGFYWDEGFHLLPIGLWDIDLSLEIIKSWFGLMDQDGWIAREQILGEEARSKVPPEFQIQYPHYANPPTLILAVNQFLQQLDEAEKEKEEKQAMEYEFESSRQQVLEESQIPWSTLSSAHIKYPVLATEYLQSLYPKLKQHYYWFRKSQIGDIRTWEREAFSLKEGYRWRGRTPDHCFTSGLDDYPRAKPPHIGELHVDLISWMGMFTRMLMRIAEKLGQSDDVEEFKKIEESIIRNIDDLHWSEKDQAYCDSTIDEYEESILVCHKGYLSLFPMLLGLLPADSPHLGAILLFMSDPEEIWSPYGLRSLSKKDPHFSQGENYWRGPVWININFLALSSLKKNYIDVDGPFRETASRIYNELRENVIQNIFNEWERTGFAWEQYDQETGRGQRSFPFTGWTSMVIMIMAEKQTSLHHELARLLTTTHQMDLRQGPVRGGNRGGQGLFKWDDIKEDKHRENYLGHSLKAPMGRWQKGKDLEWFNKKKDGNLSKEEIRREEIRKIKEAEEDALAEALGFKVTRKKEGNVDQEEIAKAIKTTEKDDDLENETLKEEDNQGLGFHGGLHRYRIQNIDESELTERQDGTRGGLGGLEYSRRDEKERRSRRRDDDNQDRSRERIHKDDDRGRMHHGDSRVGRHRDDSRERRHRDEGNREKRPRDDDTREKKQSRSQDYYQSSRQEDPHRQHRERKRDYSPEARQQQKSSRHRHHRDDY